MTLLLRLPAWAQVLIYFVIMALATQIAGMFPFLQDFWFFMLLALSLSWLFLRSEGRTLRDTHLLPERSIHWKQAAWGTLAGGAMSLTTFFITLQLTGDQWIWAGVTDWTYIGILFLTCLWSSVVQEFAFRGYPFQTLLKHYGTLVAQAVIAIPFALMHLHPGMNAAEISLTILTTGIGSLFFGIAYIKTRHLALPIGLHLGWNFVQALFPRTIGSGEKSLITLIGNTQHYTILNTIVPYVIIMLLGILLCSRLKQTAITSTAKI